MTREQFWTIIEEIHQASGGDMEFKCQLLEERLRQLTAVDVHSFEEHFTGYYYQAYTWGLWAAAYIIGHGCSDDKFSDFRSTLVSMGRDIFENALADPQALATMNYDPKGARYEGYQYVACRVFRDLTGQDFPRSRPHPQEPSGYDWDESELAGLYPKLVEKYEFRG
jgi:hypothetical protein